jgi:formate hydrogenlyase transcriptional activator
MIQADSDERRRKNFLTREKNMNGESITAVWDSRSDPGFHNFDHEELAELGAASDFISKAQTVFPLDRRCRRNGEQLNHGFEELIGSSAALMEVLHLVRTVAPTDSTVLIEGETGTGKELVAAAIHAHSQRRHLPFVKLNCAAIPLGLLESELFGHEKGAFTGAVARKLGRFELAHRGTLFLDEIGDIPLELQAKLLRVLQEGEFERLGSTQTQRVNVRLVAATNGNLAKLVMEKRFRSDLYYRLNVFPISVPALRDRVEDIPLLVRHFVAKYSEKMGKHVDTVPPEMMKVLTARQWPGNIRELQNFIERSIILTTGNELSFPLQKAKQVPSASQQLPVTLEDAERLHICRTLKQTNGVIGGPNGAAARLAVKRSTLYFRMQKLGIPRTIDFPNVASYAKEG